MAEPMLVGTSTTFARSDHVHSYDLEHFYKMIANSDQDLDEAFERIRTLRKEHQAKQVIDC